MTLWTDEAVAEELPSDRGVIRREYRACERCGSRWGNYLVAYAGWVCGGCMVELAIEAGQRIRAWIAAQETEDKGNG